MPHLARNVHPTLNASSATNAAQAAIKALRRTVRVMRGVCWLRRRLQRAARIAVAAAPNPAEGEEVGGEVTIERDGIEAAEERQGAAHQGEAAIEANASETPRAVVASKVVS